MKLIVMFTALALSACGNKPFQTCTDLETAQKINGYQEAIQELELKLAHAKSHNEYLRNELDGLRKVLRFDPDIDPRGAMNTTFLMETAMAHIANYLQDTNPKLNGYDGGYDDCYNLTEIIEYKDRGTGVQLRERVMPIGDLPPEVVNACNIIMGNEY